MCSCARAHSCCLKGEVTIVGDPARGGAPTCVVARQLRPTNITINRETKADYYPHIAADMRRRVMKDTAPAKGTADRYMPETPSGNTSKSASYYFLVASSMLVAVCLLVLICASTGIEVIKNKATTRDESTKDLASLAKPKLRESKLDLNQTIGAASKQRVALPNLLLIEAGTFAVRILALPFPIIELQYTHILTRNANISGDGLALRSRCMSRESIRGRTGLL